MSENTIDKAYDTLINSTPDTAAEAINEAKDAIDNAPTNVVNYPTETTPPSNVESEKVMGVYDPKTGNITPTGDEVDEETQQKVIEALSNVFDKQAKKISSLEAKLDRMIVESTISNKNNKIDMSPMEDTLNRFLVAIDSRMAEQQNKIQSLEQKLEDVMSKVDTKDTAQLTKKVGGMDRQIAKLNKCIEKIASHVVEK